MSINSISSSTTIAASLTVQTATETATQATTDAITDSDATDEASPVKLSDGARMRQRLAALAKDDPEKFKEVASKISKQLADEADKGGDGAAFLKHLSDQFASAAQSGDVSSLKPPQHEHGAGGHHHGGHKGAPATGAAAYRQQDEATRGTFDSVRQTVDGIISNALDAG